MEESINTVAVCGAGTMGAGIALVAAQAGFTTILFDKNDEAIEKATSGIHTTLSSLVEKKKITADERQITIDALRFTNRVEDCKADLVIEAIIEMVDAKRALFKTLASFNSKETIFATNTSSLSVSDIAAAIPEPQRVAGLHFFNPPTLMKLVEVVKARDTDEQVIQKLVRLVTKCGKIAVVCKDLPGFIVNRVARPYYLEALRLAEEGIDFETIDNVLEASGFKMGPFRLMDLIGNDINLAVTVSLYEAFNKPSRFQPSPIQQQKVKLGDLGRKTGKGYYQY